MAFCSFAKWMNVLLLFAFVVLIAVVGFVWAYNPSGTGDNPAVMGHSVGEMDWSQPLPSNLYVTGDVGIGTISMPSNLLVSGNVGIGTLVPTQKLDVVGNIRGTQLCIGSDCRSAWPSGASLPVGVVGQTLRHDGTNWIANGVLFNNGTNVGIGTASPNQKLSVAGTIESTSGGIKFPDGTLQKTAAAEFGNRTLLAAVSTTVNAGVTNIDLPATKALTAGEFICVIEWTGADLDQRARAEAYSDSAATPTTILGYASIDYSYNNIKWASYSFIVRKNDYYMAKWIGVYGNNAPVTRRYYWLPIGN